MDFYQNRDINSHQELVSILLTEQANNLLDLDSFFKIMNCAVDLSIEYDPKIIGTLYSPTMKIYCAVVSMQENGILLCVLINELGTEVTLPNLPLLNNCFTAIVKKDLEPTDFDLDARLFGLRLSELKYRIREANNFLI